MYKLCVCEKCKGSFVVTKPTENEKLCDKCLNSKEAELTFEDSIDNENFVCDFEPEVYKRSRKDLFIGAALKEKEFRNIAILFCRSIKNKYIELVGLDIFEGIVVNLVDENGKKEGLHTYKKEIANLKCGDVISVPVKFVDECKCMNMFRICGRYDKIKPNEKTDFIKLRDKYKFIYKHDICWKFDELALENFYDTFYCIVNFSETRIREYNGKLQIAFQVTDKGQRYYVDCLDKTSKTGVFKAGNYLRGLCLLKAEKKKDKSGYEYRMIKNMAKISDKMQKKNYKGTNLTEISFTDSLEQSDLPF